MITSRQSCIVILLLLAAVALGGGGIVDAHQATAKSQEHHAGLILQFADGSVQKYCLTFSEDYISGLDLLLKSGLEVKLEAYGGMGGAVCKIGNDGCDYPGQPCWCQSYGSGGVYWSYHHLKDGQWKSSVLGAGSYKVHDGDVEGWAWSSGNPPPLFTFGQICTSLLPAPVNTNTPVAATPTQARLPTTATSRPKPTHTKQPTARSAATPTRIQPRVTGTPRLPIIEATTTLTPISSTTPTPTISTTLPSVTPTPTLTQSPLAVPTRTATPTPGPPATNAGDNQAQARTIAIMAGLGAALTFVLWRGLAIACPHQKKSDVD